jgi:FkbM family methyltransferase
MDSGLIYDVGMHNGDDTAYYLHLGYRVVGIEASPLMIATLRKRFFQDISGGRLTLLNVGVAKSEGQLDFWICDEVSEWSSFNLEIASRNGAKHHSVSVDTLTFSSILSRYEVPFYCKIDIEGNDLLCLNGLVQSDLPPFISLEMGHADGNIAIDLLYALGYKKFKIISQVTWAQPLPIFSSYENGLNRTIRGYLHRIDRKLRGARCDGDWTFRSGSSGAFGEATSGPWRSHARVLKQWQILHDADLKYGARGIGGNWFDIHASLI